MSRRWMALPVTAVIGIGGLAAVPAGGAAVRAPACSHRAIAAGLRRGPDRETKAGTGKIGGFGCAGSYAYAFVNTTRITYTALLKAQNGRWTTVSRARYCRGTTVPRKIRKPACETN